MKLRTQRAAGSGQSAVGQPACRSAFSAHCPLPTAHCPLPTAHCRAGFTLLELLLASVIGLVLLSGLYIALNVTVQQTQASREAADVEDLSRGAFNRIAIDLSAVLGPLPPKTSGAQNAGGSGTPTSSTPSSGGMTGGTGGTGMTGATDMTGAMDPNAGTDMGTEVAASNMPFGGGVIGTSDGDGRQMLVLFVSRVPNVLGTPGELNQPSDTSKQVSSDMYRIIYWKGANGGLCREARPWVTADGVGNSTSPDLSNEGSNTIVDEVADFNAQFWDGTSWLTEWDGTTSSASGSGMAGPPKAIKITLAFEFPNPKPGGEPIKKTVTQVIPVRTAPGLATATLVDPVPSTGTTTTDSTGGMTGMTGTSSTSGGAGGMGGGQ